jgi:hypothetical protein
MESKQTGENRIAINSELVKGGFGLIPKTVMERKDVSIGAKSLYALLACYADKNRKCYPSRAEICGTLGLSINSFNKYIKQLVDAGAIVVTKNRAGGCFANNVYTLLNPGAVTDVTLDENNRDAKNTVAQNNRDAKFDSTVAQNLCSTVAQNLPPNNTNITIPINNTKREGKNASRFIPPTLDEVKQFWREHNFVRSDPEEFWYHYSSNGWVQGRGNKLKSWQAAAHNWEKREAKFAPKLLTEAEKKRRQLENLKAQIAAKEAEHENDY